MLSLLEIIRSWGILSLTIAYCWQLYTLWILVQLHEAVPGKRYNRYVELAQAAFGERRGDNEIVLPNSLWAALFIKSPNNRLSLIGAITAITYSTMVWVLSVSQQRPPTISYEPLSLPSFSASVFSVMNALGIVAFAFRGHNLAMEIQATMPSTFKHPAHVPMWKGAKVAYFFIALCLFPVAIGGFWAYGQPYAFRWNSQCPVWISQPRHSSRTSCNDFSSRCVQLPKQLPDIFHACF
ncbi:hypothetical protein OIU74_007148 [Salix koriyanagi]|uniref:Amino acid transporter transmembrane domain-containing protein n=1 Tax=Salix koriyanagi TaxID=2511006 RepID=A0A9Q0U2Z8_9ROSI|nr:hypothetical protein OIU74_007148 [Salix koriyanagi]